MVLGTNCLPQSLRFRPEVERNSMETLPVEVYEGEKSARNRAITLENLEIHSFFGPVRGFTGAGVNMAAAYRYG